MGLLDFYLLNLASVKLCPGHLTLCKKEPWDLPCIRLFVSWLQRLGEESWFLLSPLVPWQCTVAPASPGLSPCQEYPTYSLLLTPAWEILFWLLPAWPLSPPLALQRWACFAHRTELDHGAQVCDESLGEEGSASQSCLASRFAWGLEMLLSGTES